MKTTIEINGKEVEIELTDEQVKQIQNASKNEFEIEYGNNSRLIKSAHKSSLDFGVVRHTKELAEISAKRMRQANKLEELVMHLDPEWRADWNDEEQPKYYLVFDSKFGLEWRYITKFISTVYGSYEAMSKICDALNNDELPELAEILKGGK